MLIFILFYKSLCNIGECVVLEVNTQALNMPDLLTLLLAIVIGIIIFAGFMYVKYPTIGADFAYFKQLAKVGAWLGYQLLMKRTILDIFESWVSEKDFLHKMSCYFLGLHHMEHVVCSWSNQ